MKEVDYYAVLNIPRDATTEEIALAYRKLAIQHHPCRDRNQTVPLNPSEGVDELSHLPALPSAAIWGYVNKAYDILSNPLRRQVYDTYGESGLNNGVPLPDGNYFQPYVYHNNYFQTYSEVFGSYSPYANIIDALINPLCIRKQGEEKIQDKPIEKILYFDLKEIYEGVTKRMRILRHEFVDTDKNKTEIREKILIVPIPAGTFPGTRITFKEQGDRSITRIPADIIFITADAPHKIFSRKLSDLYMNYEIDLKQALCGFKLTINTLDDRKLCFLIQNVTQPNYVKKISGEGLPKPNEKNQKGDLYVTFNVKLPVEITRNLKLKFIRLFDELKQSEKKEHEKI